MHAQYKHRARRNPNGIAQSACRLQIDRRPIGVGGGRNPRIGRYGRCARSFIDAECRRKAARPIGACEQDSRKEHKQNEITQGVGIFSRKTRRRQRDTESAQSPQQLHEMRTPQGLRYSVAGAGQKIEVRALICGVDFNEVMMIQ